VFVVVVVVVVDAAAVIISGGDIRGGRWGNRCGVYRS